jgi:proline iminopeptidase
MLCDAGQAASQSAGRHVLKRFPAIEPYEHGMLAAGDGQSIYWEACGNPDGKPAVVLHGGPGSGCTVEMRRSFDPGAYRIILLDQRGAGRSTPRVTYGTDLSANTTDHLIADLELLRTHLGADIDWLYHDTGRFFPQEWARFREGVPEQDRESDLVAAYNRLLNDDPDPDVRRRAAQRWCDWEDAVQSLEAGRVPDARYADPAFRITFARIVAHYFHHRAWLRHDELLEEAHHLAGTPGVLVHGRMDIGGPADGAWQLAQVWPDAELHLVDTGHGGGEEMTARLIDATNRFAAQP